MSRLQLSKRQKQANALRHHSVHVDAIYFSWLPVPVVHIWRFQNGLQTSFIFDTKSALVRERPFCCSVLSPHYESLLPDEGVLGKPQQ